MTTSMTTQQSYVDLQDLVKRSGPFMSWLIDWHRQLPAIRLEDIVGSNPRETAILSVDVINGFCYEGVLSSPRVANIVQPIASLFTRAYELGVRDIVLTQDTHNPQA